MQVTTTIQIEDGTWEDLNARKRKGESFDDVVSRLLADTEVGEA